MGRVGPSRRTAALGGCDLGVHLDRCDLGHLGRAPLPSSPHEGARLTLITVLGLIVGALLAVAGAWAGVVIALIATAAVVVAQGLDGGAGSARPVI